MKWFEMPKETKWIGGADDFYRHAFGVKYHRESGHFKPSKLFDESPTNAIYEGVKTLWLTYLWQKYHIYDMTYTHVIIYHVHFNGMKYILHHTVYTIIRVNYIYSNM